MFCIKEEIMDSGRITSYYFVVEIDDIETARFTECDGIEMSKDIFEVVEGGYNTSTHKFVGKNRCPNIILKKGITDNDDLLKWYQNCINGNFERKSGAVILKDAANEEVKRWNFFNAFPCRWKGLSFHANDNGYAIELIELAHE
jgi:phage tail-like protein